VRALLLFAVLASVTAAGETTLALREGKVTLGAKPVHVTLSLGKHRDEALAAARAGRHLMLRIEGLGASAQPDVVWEIHISGQQAGMLSLYGIQGEQNGKGIVETDITKAALRELERGSVLHLTFVPRSAEAVAHPRGKVWFRRILLVAG
jgi:hypothetical protein